MDGVWIKLRARRDRIISRLKTRDRRDDNVKGDVPCGGVLGGGSYVDVIASSKLEEFAKFEAALGDNGMIFFLVCVEIPEIRLGRRVRCEFS